MVGERKNRPVFNGRTLTWSEAALSIHQCLWCHNETPKHQDTATSKAKSFFIVRRFGSAGDGAVGKGGASAQAAWRSAYEALSPQGHSHD